MDAPSRSPAFDASPFATHLGITLEHAGPGYARVRMPVQPVHLQTAGAVQGGILVVLADGAFFQALRTLLEPGETAWTVEIKVNYLSPARLGEVLVAEGRIVQRGGRVAVGDMEVRDVASSRLVLKGLGTCLIQRAQGDGG